MSSRPRSSGSRPACRPVPATRVLRRSRLRSSRGCTAAAAGVRRAPDPRIGLAADAAKTGARLRWPRDETAADRHADPPSGRHGRRPGRAARRAVGGPELAGAVSRPASCHEAALPVRLAVGTALACRRLAGRRRGGGRGHTAATRVPGAGARGHDRHGRRAPGDPSPGDRARRPGRRARGLRRRHLAAQDGLRRTAWRRLARRRLPGDPADRRRGTSEGHGPVAA
jgi:hypothetical protein